MVQTRAQQAAGLSVLCSSRPPFANSLPPADAQLRPQQCVFLKDTGMHEWPIEWEDAKPMLVLWRNVVFIARNRPR